MKTLFENPLMIFLISALRHVITGAMLVLIALLKLPDDLRSEVEAAADWTAPIVAAFLAWFVLKYGVIMLKKIGYVQIVVFSTACLGAFSLTSCGYVDTIVDTTGAEVIEPDRDEDGLSDKIKVPSSQVEPSLNTDAVNELVSEKLEGINDSLKSATK